MSIGGESDNRRCTIRLREAALLRTWALDVHGDGDKKFEIRICRVRKGVKKLD